MDTMSAVRVTGRTRLPTDAETGIDGAPTEYVLPYRGGETVFRVGPASGTWEVEAYNRDGDLLWNVSTSLWNSETFAKARFEALDIARVLGGGWFR